MTKKGFTLAEVLITLGIIGIVAAMTIPTLMANYQKHVYVTQLEKFYSVFENGMKLYMANNSCTTLQCTDLFNGWFVDATWATNMQGELNKIFKISNSDCIPFNGNCKESTKFLNGNAAGDQFSAGTFTTLDGFVISIMDGDSGNCQGYPSLVNSTKLKNYCSEIYVDVNGPKQPNTYGRDIFYFLLGNDGLLYPGAGAEWAKAVPDSANNNNTYYWRSNARWCGTPDSPTLAGTTLGDGCAARIIDEGWQMNY